MNIYTSYFAKLKYLPKNIMPIIISNSMPKIANIEYYHMKELAPDWNILNSYKTSNNQEEYTKMYYSNILSKLNAKVLVENLMSICKSNNKDGVAFICYESPEKFCHRHLLANWIEKETGQKVEEYVY